ncbi:hypothetical protein A2U01_0061793 [Trifolium medium]|uniref:Uncharacterized protein n=1 Tax=Trifolium medium TaxID=97028 RepID=A0A392RXQ0_9FABA|nr:hypothetical protein [Trifolium medium]
MEETQKQRTKIEINFNSAEIGIMSLSRSELRQRLEVKVGATASEEELVRWCDDVRRGEAEVTRQRRRKRRRRRRRCGEVRRVLGRE